MVIMNKLWMEKRNIYLLITPGLLFITGLILVPIAIAIFLSFTNYDGVDFQLIGIKNYLEIFFHDSVFWSSLRNALFLGICFILLQHPIAVFLAIVTPYCGRWERPLRVIIFIRTIWSYKSDIGFRWFTFMAAGLAWQSEYRDIFDYFRSDVAGLWLCIFIVLYRN
jgi:ABC-type sugar transport system permease subunit